MLVLANLFWGLSFPLIKAIAFEHQQLLPASSSWFITACMLAPRFLLATAILLVWRRRALRGLSRPEIRQGVGLALFAIGLGVSRLTHRHPLRTDVVLRALKRLVFPDDEARDFVEQNRAAAHRARRKR